MFFPLQVLFSPALAVNGRCWNSISEPLLFPPEDSYELCFFVSYDFSQNSKYIQIRISCHIRRFKKRIMKLNLTYTMFSLHQPDWSFKEILRDIRMTQKNLWPKIQNQVIVIIKLLTVFIVKMKYITKVWKSYKSWKQIYFTKCCMIVCLPLLHLNLSNVFMYTSHLRAFYLLNLYYWVNFCPVKKKI